MFDNRNTYTIRTETKDGTVHYFISFRDGQGIRQETEITYELFNEFQRFMRKERNLLRSDERHIEQNKLSDEMLYYKIFHEVKSIEEIVIQKELAEYLRQVIHDLPLIQRRRFLFYYENGDTYKQIAKREGCSARAVEYSIAIARKKVIEKIKKFLN